MVLDPVRMSRALAAVGLPPPVAVRPLGRPLFGRTLELVFPEGARLPVAVLKIAGLDPGWGGVGAERAALRAAHLFTELPVPREYAVLDPGLDGPAMSLASRLPGEQGSLLIARGGPPGEEAARQVGRVLATLEGAFQPGFATRATPEGELLPRRASWREEVGALIAGWRARAEAAGTSLGPLSERLWAMAGEGLGALDEVYSFALVHGNLHPGNLLLDPADGRLLGVIDWEHAFAGDPLWDLAHALALPTPTLARVLEGYGRDRAAELLAPEALARLGVYWRARCLMRLAVAALPGLGEAEGRPRALLLEIARERAAEAVEHEAPRHRLEAALAGARGPIQIWARPASSAVLTRRALEVARQGERLGASAGMVGAALAAAALARREEEPARGALLLLGERLLPRVAAAVLPLPGEPVADRAVWWRALAAASVSGLEALREPGPCGALLLLALARRGLRELDEAVSDGTLRGLEALVHGLLARERVTRGRELAPAERLLAAWGAAWALRELGLDAGGGLRARLERQGGGAWEALAAAGSPEGPAPTALLRERARELERGVDPLLPVALLAWSEGLAAPGVAAHPASVLAALWPSTS